MEFSHDLPISNGINPQALLNIVNTLDKCNCHSIMFLKNGKIICEGWWKPYNPNYNHVLFSLSKSFVATAISFAIQENLITFEDHITKFFPDYFPCLPCEYMQRVRIKHLLSMTYGTTKKTTEIDFYLLNDWLAENLHIYLEKEPGTEFNYDNRCSFLCSVIIQKVTGLTVFDYLNERLFKPLGIEKIWWESKNGFNMGRGGLNMKTIDLAKFGIFLLHKGQWNNQQLLRPDLIDEMTRCHTGTSTINFTRTKAPDYMKGYGYFFWMCQPDMSFRGDGACCQYLVVMPKQNMVIALTAGSMAKGQVMLNSLWDNLVYNIPNPDMDSSIIQKQLDEKLNSLKIPFYKESTQPYRNFPSNYSKYNGKIYDLCPNKLSISKVSFEFGDNEDIIKLFESDNKVIILHVGHDKWIENETNSETENFHAHTTIIFNNIACSSRWIDEDNYAMKFVYTRTPYADTMTLKFTNKGIVGDYTCFPVMPHRGNNYPIMGIMNEK